MKKILVATMIAFSLFLSGCAQVNPRLDGKIDNQNGQIDSIKNNQNGIMSEIGNLKQQSAVQSSNLKDVQQGMVNLQSKVLSQENNNSGVQILQGDGPLIAIFGIGVIALILWYFRSQASKYAKTAEILASQIAKKGDDELTDRVMRSAMYTDVEKDVYRLIMKHKRS